MIQTCLKTLPRCRIYYSNSKLNCKLLVLLFIILCKSHLYAQNITISGHVKDDATGDALYGANVYSQPQKYGQATDINGFFSFQIPVQNENLTLIFSYVGYTLQKHTLKCIKDTTLAIALIKENVLSEIQVYAPRRDFGVNNSQMSAIELPIVQVKSLPALFGEIDVMKAIQRMPGVQSAGDGNAGIYVRGGNYDQNLITLDGSTLYNSEHLNGFVSALNADMIDNIIFYKGAFPARYGERLSSVIDIGMKEGDFEKYHANLSFGMLSSKVHIEGPIRKETTSFNIGVRLSYFDAIVQPLLENIYDNPSSLRPYSYMNYYDINTKLTHKFSSKDKLSAVFYLGKDINNSAPTDSKQTYETMVVNERHKYDNSKKNSTDNKWGNIVSSLFWTHTANERLSVNTNFSYSKYDYMLNMASYVYKRNEVISYSPAQLHSLYEENSHAKYNSGIDDMALFIDFHYIPDTKHNIRWGGKASFQYFTPTVEVYKHTYEKFLQGGSYIEKNQLIDTILGKKQNLKTVAFYIEDDYSISKKLKMNAGLRYTLFAVEGKGYHSLEPRLSLRYLLTDDMALKLSYARMSQGIHLLSSSNLIMPSDIWVPVTKDIPIMKSNQFAIGYNQNVGKGIDILIEGYYKTMNNVIDYKEGVSYMTSSGDWQQMIALGKGHSYGVELLLQKKSGKTTGWIGYTWSKSFRQYNRSGMEISGGVKFYDGNDRRNNFNIVIAHHFNKHWDISAAWTYQTGRRGIISTTAMYGGKLDEYDPYGKISSSNSHIAMGDCYGESTDGAAYFRKFSRFYTYSERNGYQLPDIHRLDLNINYSIEHKKTGESIIGLSIYNLYNRMNISNVYIGYDNNKTVLKGVCMFPFMPSLNYTLKF